MDNGSVRIVSAEKSVEWIEVEVRGELLEFLRAALRSGAYESKQELLRDGFADLKRAGSGWRMALKKQSKKAASPVPGLGSGRGPQRSASKACR